MRNYYTNAPCNTRVATENSHSTFSVFCSVAIIFTLLRAAFLLVPIENDGFEELAVMAFSETNAALTEDKGYLPTETAIEASAMPNLMVIPLKGVVTSGYDQREDPFGTGETELHKGIDISAAYDTKILSFADGTVEKVGYSASYGNYVIIRHADNMGRPYETLYAHCEKILVSAKESVEAGNEIAIAGSTGRSTGRHLHFEMRVNGVSVNPEKWLALAK